MDKHQENAAEVWGVRFTESEVSVLREWIGSLELVKFRGLRKAKSELMRQLFEIADVLTATGALQMTRQGVKDFLNYLREQGEPSLQSELKFPPHRYGAEAEEPERLAVGAGTPPTRRPLRYSVTRDPKANPYMPPFSPTGIRFSIASIQGAA